MNNRNILFSIVLPTYNRAHLLKGTLESFIKQEYQNFEIIIIDDGGKDNTKEMVESLNDKRISYHWQENTERGPARNFGATLAKGDYVNFFDSDDIAYPNHLSTAYNFVSNSTIPPDVFHLGWDFVFNDTIIGKHELSGRLNEHLFHNNVLCCHNVFVKREILSSFSFPDERALIGAEDYLLWLRLSMRYEIHGIATVTSALVQHGERSMTTFSGNDILYTASLLERELRKDKIFVEKYLSKLPIILNDYDGRAALHFAIEGNRKEAIKYFMKTISYNPKKLFTKRTLATIKYLIIA